MYRKGRLGRIHACWFVNKVNRQYVTIVPGQLSYDAMGDDGHLELLIEKSV